MRSYSAKHTLFYCFFRKKKRTKKNTGGVVACLLFFFLSRLILEKAIEKEQYVVICRERFMAWVSTLRRESTKGRKKMLTSSRDEKKMKARTIVGDGGEKSPLRGPGAELLPLGMENEKGEARRKTIPGG